MDAAMKETTTPAAGEASSESGVVKTAMDAIAYEAIESLIKRQKRKYGPEAHEQVVQLALYHAQQQRADPDPISRDTRDCELLTGRLADRDIHRGEIVLLGQSGVPYVVSRVFAAGGTFVAVFVPAEPETGGGARQRRSAKVVCRGSAAGRGGVVAITSIMNQMVPEMGSIGVKAVWPLLYAYAREEGIEEVEVLGKSMGGSIAQQLAILFETVGRIHVSRLVTVCSVGAGDSVNAVFRDRVLAERETPFDIVVIRNGGDENGECVDYVPAVGGVHVGFKTDPEKCHIEVRYLGPREGIKPAREQTDLDGRELLRKFFGSFGPGNGHGRQTTLWKEWSWESVTDQAEVDGLLALGDSTVEQLRGWLVAINRPWLWRWGQRLGCFIHCIEAREKKSV